MRLRRLKSHCELLPLQRRSGHFTSQHGSFVTPSSVSKPPSQLSPSFPRAVRILLRASNPRPCVPCWSHRRGSPPRRGVAIRVGLDILFPIQADGGKGQFQEVPHAVGFPRGQHVVVRLALLENHPHAANVVAR